MRGCNLFHCRIDQVKELADSMINKILVTKQTGEAGKICNSVMVTMRMFPRKEYYMAVMLERTFDVSMNIYNPILFYKLIKY